jgi:ATP-dependent exoDNAse (exonuclease V) beta subunit
VRALYVAATRARRALHWVGVAKEKEDGTLAPPAGSFLRLLWPALEAEFAQARPVGSDGDGGDAAAFVPQLVRLAEPVASWVPPALRAAAPAAGEAEQRPAPAAEEEGGRLASDVGTLVHAYLEMIARDGLEAWPRERVDGLRDAMALWFGQQGHGAKDAASGAGRSREALLATLASEQGRWALAARTEAAAEFAVTSALDGQFATHVVDRTFVEDGVRWIIDYKTAEVGTGGTAALAERYRPQLERYAALFAGESLPIRMGILYAAVGELIELAPRR